MTKKFSSDYKRTGRNVSEKPRKKRKKIYNKNGIEIHGERPARQKVINGEVFY